MGSRGGSGRGRTTAAGHRKFLISAERSVRHALGCWPATAAFGSRRALGLVWYLTPVFSGRCACVAAHSAFVMSGWRLCLLLGHLGLCCGSVTCGDVLPFDVRSSAMVGRVVMLACLACDVCALSPCFVCASRVMCARPARLRLLYVCWSPCERRVTCCYVSSSCVE